MNYFILFPHTQLGYKSLKVRFEPVLQISKLRLHLDQNSTLCTAMSLLIFHNAKRAFNLEKSIYCTTNLGKVKLLKKKEKIGHNFHRSLRDK